MSTHIPAENFLRLLKMGDIGLLLERSSDSGYRSDQSGRSQNHSHSAPNAHFRWAENASPRRNASNRGKRGAATDASSQSQGRMCPTSGVPHRSLDCLGLPPVRELPSVRPGALLCSGRRSLFSAVIAKTLGWAGCFTAARDASGSTAWTHIRTGPFLSAEGGCLSHCL